MKEALVARGLKVTIRETQIPKPGPHQIVSKVIYAGSNPKDWKNPELTPNYEPFNQGDDISGVVHEVGDHVTEFKPGDRIIALHQYGAPHGAYAEYALSWAHTTVHLPDNVSFEEGASIPMAALTAADGLFACLRLPEPWLPTTEPTPLIIYGAASAVGAYAVQLAKRANIHPLICVAGKGIPFVESLIDRTKGDIVIDYRQGDEAVVKHLQDAARKHGKITFAFDAVSDKGSYINISKVLDRDSGKITLVNFGKFEEIPTGIEKSIAIVGAVHGAVSGICADLSDFGFVHFRFISRGLSEGWFKAHPQEIVPGGLAGVEQALLNLKEGKASAVKYVVKVGDAPGAVS